MRGKEKIVEEIEKLTGLKRTTVRAYLDIAGLPDEIIALMKEPSECSEKEKELLKGMPVTGTDVLF